MAAAKRVSVTFQMLWPSATTNSGGLAAAKLITKLGKISRNGNTDDQSYVYVIRSATDVRSSSRAAPNSSAKWSTISSQKGRAPYGRNYGRILQIFMQSLLLWLTKIYFIVNALSYPDCVVSGLLGPHASPGSIG